MATRLIGIAGPSGAGKTTLAQGLAARLPGATAIVGLDCYYRDLAHLAPPARARCNFDHPESIDSVLLAAQLEALANGRAVVRPTYDFATHTRARQGARVEPGDQVVVEGLFALFWEPVRRLMHTRVYVEAPDAACLRRRLARDVSERGRTADSVRAQYARTVRPMAARFVLPTRTHADLVVDGTSTVVEAVERIVAHLSRRPG